MKILEKKLVTIHEAYELLKEQKEEDFIKSDHKLLTNEVLSYLESNYTLIEKPIEAISLLIQRLQDLENPTPERLEKIKGGLKPQAPNRFELFQLVNLLPTQLVDLQLIMTKCRQRFPEEIQKDILDWISQVKQINTGKLLASKKELLN